MKHLHGEARWAHIAFSAILAAVSWFLPLELALQAHALFTITIFTGAMWFSEALPLHVTALLSTILLVLFASVSPTAAFSHYFSPTVVLFFGGFMIARAMQRHGLDRQIALGVGSKFGSGPRLFLLGLMAITTFLSLWISNTAATAIMLPIALVTIGRLKKLESPYAKAMVLGIAFAATIGGIGTLVGTPPNGIVVANLAEKGIHISFLDWLGYGLPFAILFLPVCWFILVSVFPPEIKKIEFTQKAGKWGAEHKLVLAVLVLTILTWVTSFAHHVADAVVAIGAVVLLYALGLLRTDDLSKIEWSALILFGGGLALGAAIDSSGLGADIGGFLGGLLHGQGIFVVFLAVIAFAVIMTLTASNTATAAIIIPIMIPLAAMVGVGVRQLAILAGIGTSLDFIVPVGTPPSTIAYSTGYVRMGDMVKVGIPVTIAGALLLAFLAWLYW